MNIVKLGRKGQVSIPRSVLRSVGVNNEQFLSIETTEDGAIILRPAVVYPVENYTDERIEEFLSADTMPDSLRERAENFLAQLKAKPQS